MIRLGIAFLLCLLGFQAECSSDATTLSTKAQSKRDHQSKLKIHTTVDLTYASQYVTDGFRVGEGQPVLQPMLKLINSTYEYTLMYWSSIQTNRNLRVYDEHDLIAGFNHNYLINSSYAFNFHTSYNYWFYPNSRLAKDKFGDPISDVERHGSKIQVGVSMLNLLPFAGSFVVPSYNLNYWAYWQDDRRDKDMSGARHELSLKYHRLIPEYIKAFQKPYAGIFTSLNYIDSAFDVRSGWSHSTATLYSGFQSLDCFFTASLNQQWSYQSTVNKNNEFWTTLSLTKEF